jgi:hypothetical protein
VHCLLQLLQTPVRFAFFFRLCLAEHQHGDLKECIRQLVSSRMWRCSKAVAIGSYAWFVLGVTWLLNSETCETCPGINMLCLAIVLTVVARMLLTLVAFYQTFPQGSDVQPPKPQGASWSLIDSIPHVRFNSKLTCFTSDRSCAVCLSDFEDGDLLRRLPCNHSFHIGCIDKWLMQNRECPLCRHDVEVRT